MFSRPQTTELQETPVQLLIISLKASKSLADLMWCGKEVHILSPELLRLLVP